MNNKLKKGELELLILHALGGESFVNSPEKMQGKFYSQDWRLFCEEVLGINFEKFTVAFEKVFKNLNVYVTKSNDLVIGVPNEKYNSLFGKTLQDSDRIRIISQVLKTGEVIKNEDGFFEKTLTNETTGKKLNIITYNPDVVRVEKSSDYSHMLDIADNVLNPKKEIEGIDQLIERHQNTINWYQNAKQIILNKKS